jgi:hypothetical protein
MSTSRHNRWFQFGLATAVILMFEAGFLLWLNIQPPSIVQLKENDFSSYGVLSPAQKIDYKVEFHGRGWPFRNSGFLAVQKFDSISNIYYKFGPDKQGTTTVDGFPEPVSAMTVITRHDSPLYYNVLVGIGLLALTAFLSESVLRRSSR